MTPLALSCRIALSIAGLSMGIASHAFASGLTPNKASDASICFTASIAIEAIVQARLGGAQKDQAKEAMARKLRSLPPTWLDYLADEADKVYAEDPGRLETCAGRHDAACLAARAPSVNRDKTAACYLEATYMVYLARRRDEGMSRKAQMESVAGQSEFFRQVTDAALATLYADPPPKLVPGTEYLNCLEAPEPTGFQRRDAGK